ncbi:MAG: tail fiber protein [Desulfuromonadales bacterium]
MAEPFIGEIRLFSFNTIPEGWVPCDGQSLNIRQYTALFSLLRTTFGGDGVNTFNLPDLRGRVPLSRNLRDPNYYEGKSGGSEKVQLGGLLQHTHPLMASSAAAAAPAPGNNVLAKVSTTGKLAYTPTKGTKYLGSASVDPDGGSGFHANMQPSLVLSFCVATVGLYPPQP